MLVLLSFGLVLLATILLVVGLLNDDGIQLIYFSIAASATAAVVLYLAFRRARPQDDVRTDAPEPLPDDLEPRSDDSTVVIPAAAAPAAPAPVPPAPAPAVPPAAAVSDPEPEPAVSTTGSTDDAWADDADWEVDDLQFPIADYDELSVAEIMPLLPQLYSDELDIVYEREQTGKNRATILARLEKLKETGTEADAEEAQAAGDAAAEAPTPPPVPAPMPAPPTVSLLDDEDEDAGAFFPIADYDDLSVSQIVPLLPQLELDELEDVKARERAGANRITLIAEIDRYLSGELEAFSWSDTDEEPAAEAPAATAAPAPSAPASAAAADTAPITGYDTMTVADIRPRLGDLSATELAQLLDYETARDNRKTIVAEITRRLEGGDEEPAAPPARKATKRAAKASKRATKATKATRSAPRSTKKASKKAAKATKKRAAVRFPIANYDELTVADIRPRLTKLSDAQLELVRERELTGAGRKTILNDIDSRLA